eukprot:2386602-Pleurochrysis_carterae.AAC.2
MERGLPPAAEEPQHQHMPSHVGIGAADYIIGDILGYGEGASNAALRRLLVPLQRTVDCLAGPCSACRDPSEFVPSVLGAAAEAALSRLPSAPPGWLLEAAETCAPGAMKSCSDPSNYVRDRKKINGASQPRCAEVVSCKCA